MSPLFSITGQSWSFKRKFQQFLRRKNVYLFFLFLLSGFLLYAGHRHYDWLSALKRTVNTFYYKAIDTLRFSGSPVLSQEDRLLRLHFWESRARILESENKKLKQLLQIPSSHFKTLHARVIGFVHNENGVRLLLNAGRNQGILPKAPVILGNQVLGRILELGENHARAILLYDQTSRIPVLTESERNHGIVAGDGLKGITLQLQKANTSVRPGEILQTSGLGGIYPPGLEVGRVKESKGGQLSLEASVPWDHVEYVEIILETPVPYEAGGPRNGL